MTPVGKARLPSSEELQAAFERVIDSRTPASVTPAGNAAPELRDWTEHTSQSIGLRESIRAVDCERPLTSSGPGAPLRIEALMGLDDSIFIQTAYAALLNRRPDEAGLRHYSAELAAGRSRIMVLGELRYSDEGRRVRTPVPNLRRRFLLHRLYRIRVLGRVLRTLTGVAALPGLLRDVSRLSVEVDVLHSGAIPTEQRVLALVGSTEAIVRANERTQATLRAVDVQNERTQATLRALDVQIDELSRRLGREPWAAPILALAERSDGQQATLRAVDVQNERTQATLRALDVQVDELSRRLGREPWAAPILALAERSDGQAERIAQLEVLATMDPAFTQNVSEIGEALTALRGRFGWPQEGAALAGSFESMLREHRNLAVRAIGAAEESQVRLRDQERRLSLILHDVRRLAAPGTQAAAMVEDHQARMLDPLYVAFEDRFRGSRAGIKGRQSVYLDLLRQAGAGTPDRPIVDVGSGRGELLELLDEEGLQARGVDLNESMVTLCAKAGLDCLHGDAVSYLAGLEPGSLGAVTGFHIIEHLPFTAMVALLDASLRALAPSGIVVFETPNPANLLVASRWFYLDPTHRNPLPSEMVAMVAEARGFVDVGIRALHPMEARFEAQDEVLARQLDDIFHGPQDYALIARKA